MDIIENLINKARESLKNSYSPYSRFRVGAAILTKEGLIFTGTNIENRSYGATICAERVACVKAISEGYKEFISIAIISIDYDNFLPPCGICRQFLTEFTSDIQVIMANKYNQYIIKNINELLPYDSLFELK